MNKRIKPSYLLISGVFMYVAGSLLGNDSTSDYVTTAKFVGGMLVLVGVASVLFGIVGLISDAVRKRSRKTDQGA